MAEFFKKDKGLTFQELIWKTLDVLREASSHEFREPVKKLVLHDGWSEEFIEPDARQVFIQLCEYLADTLRQEFSKEEENEYKSILDEIAKKQQDKGTTGKDYVLFKIEKMREAFRLIMRLLKAKNYNIKSGIGRIEETDDGVEEQ